MVTTDFNDDIYRGLVTLYVEESENINPETMDKKQLQIYLLKKWNSIDLEDNEIIRNSKINYLNSKLKIFLNIIWEYLIYKTINVEKISKICEEEIFSLEERSLQEFISSKNIHTCFNIMYEIDKINQNIKHEKDNINELINEHNIDTEYKNDNIKKDGLTINGLYFKFSPEKNKISLGIENNFNYVFFLSQEYTQELEQIINSYSDKNINSMWPYFTIDDDNFNTFQFIYTEKPENTKSIKGIIPELNLNFEQELIEKSKSTITVDDNEIQFTFKGEIIGEFDDIYFFSILSKLKGTITWINNEKKCSIISNGQNLSLEGYFQFDDYNFYGKIDNNIITHGLYFDKDFNEVYNIIEKKNDDTLFRLKETFKIDTTNRNLELGIPISFLFIYEPKKNQQNIKGKQQYPKQKKPQPIKGKKKSKEIEKKKKC